MPALVEIELPPGPEPDAIRHRATLLAAAELRLRLAKGSLTELRLKRCSFDARRQHRVWRVEMEVARAGEQLPVGTTQHPPRIERPRADARRVVVIGAGPAGLFCALDCLSAGLNVTILERGGDVRARRRPLAQIHRGERVDPESNYCFGEGGAGTYSDGKLYTRSGSRQEIQGILGTLVQHGAPDRILHSWRPHIGSNRLPQVVANLRQTLLDGGAEVLFHRRAEDLDLRGLGGHRRVAGVWHRSSLEENETRQLLPADAVVLATGHSARDALELAQRGGARLEAKGFALGVRAEHPQTFVDDHQYGGLRQQHDLPPAFYELVTQVEGRGVYSFCMCPGGWIVPATTAPDRVVTNGMSLSRRDSPFANAGLVVQLNPEDWCGERARALGFEELLGGAPQRPEDDPLIGVRIQEALERRCALAGGGRSKVPAQSIERFLKRLGGGPTLPTSYQAGVEPADMASLLPRGVAEALREGLLAFDQRIPGFVGEHGQLLAPESRTSSPVRLSRDRESFLAMDTLGATLEGFYPCGEGAGFAGGIVSAALDGRRVAQALSQRLTG
jgi:uncharacterized protein